VSFNSDRIQHTYFRDALTVWSKSHKTAKRNSGYAIAK